MNGRNDGEELKQLTAFDHFIEESFETPEKLEKNLSEIESRVALLTKGWRGTADKSGEYARDVYAQITVQLRSIMFFLRQLRTALQAKAAVPDHYFQAIETLFKDLPDKKAGRAIQAKMTEIRAKRQTGTAYEVLPLEYWQAVRLNVALHFRRAIKVGIENRLRKEADEEALREHEKAKNAGYQLGQAIREAGLGE